MKEGFKVGLHNKSGILVTALVLGLSKTDGAIKNEITKSVQFISIAPYVSK